MAHYTITFSDRDTLPQELDQMAAALGISPEQLIKRFVAAGLAEANPQNGPASGGKTLEDFLVRNGVWKELDK